MVYVIHALLPIVKLAYHMEIFVLRAVKIMHSNQIILVYRYAPYIVKNVKISPVINVPQIMQKI